MDLSIWVPFADRFFSITESFDKEGQKSAKTRRSKAKSQPIGSRWEIPLKALQTAAPLAAPALPPLLLPSAAPLLPVLQPRAPCFVVRPSQEVLSAEMQYS